MYTNGGFSNSNSTTRNVIIDLRSDTVSQPTDRMRTAMANAVVGDDVNREDPTVKQLEEKCAKMFGKEDALFVPRGTMGNLIAIMSHCKERASEAIVGVNSHVMLYEQGGAAGIAGVLLSTLPNNEDGTFSLDELRKKIRGDDRIHELKTRLVIVENTHNTCGGRVILLEWIEELSKICKTNDMKAHMDGARVFHAAEYLNVPVSRVARDVDSVQFCLSKSLCAPIGSMLVGSNDFVAYARCMRKGLGGGMRQAGILAAAGLVALEDIVPKLGDDHRRTKQIAQAIYDPYVTVEIDNVQTNICMTKFLHPQKHSPTCMAERLQRIEKDELAAGITDSHGNGISVKVFARDEWKSIRYVLYHHIDDELTELAIKKFKYCIEQLK